MAAEMNKFGDKHDLAMQADFAGQFDKTAGTMGGGAKWASQDFAKWGAGTAPTSSAAAAHEMDHQLSRITNGAIRRLARRGGVKRVSREVYGDARKVLREFLQDALHDVVLYADHANRSTITINDVLLALKRQGRALYGIGGPAGGGNSNKPAGGGGFGNK